MRGRINRGEYWLALGIIVAFLIVVSVLGVRPPQVVELMLIFLCVPRLHDLGKSGWWVCIPLAIELVGAVAAFASFSVDEAYVVFGGVMLVVVGCVVVLGLIPGQPNANRFGDPPQSMFAFKERRKVRETEEIFK